NFSLVKNVVKLNKQNEIKIDSKNRTSQLNIFAAGDVTDVSHKQVIIAAGEGAKAALNAYDYIKKLK
ncbi:FAD-dependent oxidoreductase, partial [Patescibacteria group bacterium]|nr:FAD-dependent oxidoreductase [Patescibacteria group bacterium]